MMNNLSQKKLQQLINNVVQTVIMITLVKFNQQAAAESSELSDFSESEKSSELNSNAEYEDNDSF